MIASNSSAVVLVFLTVFGVHAAAEQRPRALRNMERYRAAMNTGHIEWSYRKRALGPGGYEFYRFCTSQFAGQDVLFVNRGDPEGVVVRVADGTVRPGGMRPLLGLRKDGRLWRHREHAGSADVADVGGSVTGSPDLRSLGAATSRSYRSIHNTLWDDPSGDGQYTESKEGDLHVVTYKADYGTTRWWIDPQRGWSPVRVAFFDPKGDLKTESRSTLQKFGQVWFPKSVAFFSTGYKEGKQPYETVEIFSATFNRPDHPIALGPADIGIEIGMPITEYGRTFRPGRIVTWDGEKLISMDEYRQRRRAGELPRSPTVARESARSRARLAASKEGNTKGKPQTRIERPADLMDEWESYTRRFIAKYRLKNEQSQKAWSILKACRERADTHMTRNRADIDRIERQVRRLKQGKGEGWERKIAALAEERAKLRQPIDAIFDKQLKPRLDTLPTRKQRELAKSADDVGIRKPQ